MIRIIVGNNKDLVSDCVRICEIAIIEECLTVELYTLYKGSLLLSKYVCGIKVKVKLFSSLNVADEVVRLSSIAGTEYIRT